MRLHRTVTPKSRLWWTAASNLRVGAGVLLATTSVSGCSVLYDLSTEQCKTTEDCVALGGAFEALECRESICQEPILTGCQTNAECMDTRGDGIEPWACIKEGGSSRGDCVALRTAECPLVLPEGSSGDPLWRQNLRTANPVILAGTGVLSPNADNRIKNYELALTELTNKVIGINAGARPLVMMGCKANVASPEELDAMMTHIVDEVKVPGIVSALLADDLQRAWNDHGSVARTFFMSPLDADPTLVSILDQGLIFHVSPSADVIAWPYAPLLTRVINHLAITGPVRVATVVASDERFLSTTKSLIESLPANHGLLFNGLSVSENRAASPSNYLTVTTSLNETASANAVQQLLDFKPHVIISAAGKEFDANIIPGVERGWVAASGGQDKPFYILSPYNYNEPKLADTLLTNGTVRSRLVGVNGAGAVSPTNYNDYIGRWEAAFPEDRDVRGYENYYDAVYYLMYAAAAAARNTSVSSGEDLGDGMRRLLRGPSTFNVGDDDMPAAMAALQSTSIELVGTLGPPDFDETTGVRQTAGSVWCVNAARSAVADVLRYSQTDPNDPTTATLTGTFPPACFSGFD
jgi:hypothetical protein